MDFNKYKDIIFNKNKDVNEKIIALFLLYDRQCEVNKLSYKQKIQLVNYFIKTLSDHEEYEVAHAFKQRKFKKYRKFRLDRRINKFMIYYRCIKMKFTNLSKSKN